MENEEIQNNYSREEDIEDNEEIISNNDEFGTSNEINNISINNNSNNKKPDKNHIHQKAEHHRTKSKKLKDNYQAGTPIGKVCSPSKNIFSILYQVDDGLSLENKSNNNNRKDNINKIKNLNSKKQKLKKSCGFGGFVKKDSKSVFTKIAENIYKDSQYKKRNPIKDVRDINKIEEDAYNKLTSDQFIETCQNRENLRNKKIVQDFLNRKAKEGTFKKIGIECDRKIEMKKLQDPKRALSVTDRNRNFKSTRTFGQFLHDQKIKQHFNNNKKLQFLLNGNILPQDSTYVFTDMNTKKYLKQNDYFKKFMIKEEIEGENVTANKTFDLDMICENNNNNGNFEINCNKNINYFNNIKKSPSSSTMIKKSTNSIANKFLNLYKKILSEFLNQNIEKDFDVNYWVFLLLLHKLGFTPKNYYFSISNIDIENKDAAKEFITNMNSNERIGDLNRQSFSEISCISKDISKIINDEDDLLKNTNLKEYEKNFMVGEYDNKYELDKEYKLSKDAWKIITEKQNFEYNINVKSNKILLFFLSVLGIYKNTKWMKQHLAFIYKNKKLIYMFNNNNKYLYKYFELYKINSIAYILGQEQQEHRYQKTDDFYNDNVENIDDYISHSYTINTSLNNLAKEYDIYGKDYHPKNIDYRHKNELINNNDNGNNLNGQENSFSNTDNNSLYFIDNEKSILGSSTFADINKIFKNNPIDNVDDNDIEVDSFLFEDIINNNKNYYRYDSNKKNEEDSSNINNYLKEDENLKGKKNFGKIKYIFEIKIEDEPKKLILRNGDNKKEVVEKFCDKYDLDDNEKDKILEVIGEQLKNLSNKKNNNQKKK